MPKSIDFFYAVKWKMFQNPFKSVRNQKGFETFFIDHSPLTINYSLPHLYNQKFQVVCIFHAPDDGMVGRLGLKSYLPYRSSGIFSRHGNGL